MGTTTCIHLENISNVEHGVEEGICEKCHQVRRYQRDEGKGDKQKRISRVIKLGRIDGMAVIPGPKDIIDVSPEEKAELKAAGDESSAKHASNDIHANPGDDTSGPPRQPGGREWYQENKKEMIADLLVMDKDAFKEKWKVKRQIISQLKRDPLYTEVSPGNSSSKESNRKARPVGSGTGSFIQEVSEALGKLEKDQLPPFPSFNESWSFMVQEKWLEVYLELRAMEKGVYIGHSPKV